MFTCKKYKNKYPRTEFGSTIVGAWVTGKPGTMFTLTNQETLNCSGFFQKYVQKVEGRIPFMPRPDILNPVLPVHLQFPKPRGFSVPDQSLAMLVVTAILHIAEDSGWAIDLAIAGFIAFQFPSYTVNRVLEQTSAWATKPSPFFDVRFDLDGSRSRIRIKPETFLSTYAELLCAFSFSAADTANNELCMRSPALIERIITLLPPHWTNYYSLHASKGLTVSGNLKADNYLHPLPFSLLLGQNAEDESHHETNGHSETLSVSQPSELGQYSAEKSSGDNKPQLAIQILIGLSVILRNIRDVLESLDLQNPNQLAPETDRPLNQYMLSEPFALSECLSWLEEFFKYFVTPEHRKEFLVELTTKKETMNYYFGRQEGRYYVKKEVCGNLFQEIIMVALDTENTAPLLFKPEYLEVVVSSRLPVSDTMLFSVALFNLGNSKERCAVSIKDQLLPYITDNLQFRTIGLSQLEWDTERIEREMISLLSDLIDHDIFKLSNDSLAFKDDVSIEKVLENTLDILNKVHQFKIYEVFEEILSRFGNLRNLKNEWAPCHQCPEVPRDYLIALALRNLAAQPGGLVQIPRIWSFIVTSFPYYGAETPWSEKEIALGLQFKGPMRFKLFQVHRF